MASLTTTPLMEQYLAIKKQHKDTILFFRMGDFYEMFYEDAKIAASVLGITLTSRAHGKASDVPLAGFPHHALETHLSRMIRAGYRVAICEQTEDPKQAKTIVKRDVVEVVTPGTAVSDDLLETKRNNFLVAVHVGKNGCGLAQVDVSTGEFQVGHFSHDGMLERLAAIDPAEILVSEDQLEQLEPDLQPFRTVTLTPREDWTFQPDYAYDVLKEHFNTLSLKGFGVEDETESIGAAGAIMAYLKENQKAQLPHIHTLSRMASHRYMMIDSTTRRNLELVQSMTGTPSAGTLLSVLDQTQTPMGGRMLVNWVTFPLLDPGAIQLRLDAVQTLVEDQERRLQLAQTLKRAGDLERLMARFATGRANARDANTVRSTQEMAAEIRQTLSALDTDLLSDLYDRLDPLTVLVEEISNTLEENPPLSISDGGIIRSGVNEELDQLREIAFSGKDWIAQLQNQEREQTGIPSLKVNFNKVFGYYIEVTRPNLSKVPDHYIRKQTLVNAERFITQDLKAWEEKILGAEEKMASLEYELFDALRQTILKHIQPLQSNAQVLATLDCLVSLAQTAIDQQYNRPHIDSGDEIRIEEGRHPVVERVLPPGESFVGNDTVLDTRTDQILIITGPNMAGKSTYLRQVGLIVLMAQMGSFVPAASASVGIVDRLFTRVGASDNLAAGESTFLREMNETANILNNATPNSLVLLDEIGRGTSTFDGLSIAWSVTEFIHNTPQVSAKTIFATHYHELTELERILPRVKNYNVAVREWGDHIVFLRKIIPGGCDHSYGIHVAQLAGLPKAVIQRAQEILANLEDEALNADQVPKIAVHHAQSLDDSEQLNLFSALETKLRDELKGIDPNQLTPIEALQRLDELKQLAERDR
jgi:DNA mismatch repair protein MutS